MEDKSKRTETVKPHVGECCDSQSECDGVSSVKSDGSDLELNGETDDEDMEDGEMGFFDGSAQVRNIRDPGQPTANEHREHMTTHRPYRSWCHFCVVGHGVNSPHRRSDAQDDLEGVNGISLDCKESSEVHRPAWAQQSHALRVWRGKSHKLAKTEARLFRRDHRWKASPVGSLIPTHFSQRSCHYDLCLLHANVPRQSASPKSLASA